jgi:choline-sulfatase
MAFKKQPNILLIICDQLSAQALTAWGNSYGNAPNIDKIISNGVRFETAYTNCPLCQPARASFWTGLYPHQTGVLSNGHLHPVPEIQQSIATVGSVFSKAGYKTVHFGKQHDAGSLRGFELLPINKKEIADATPAWPVNYDTQQDSNTREQAVKFLSSYAEPRPYIAVTDLNNPHDICNWIGAFQNRKELISPDCDLPPLPDNLYRDEGEFEKLPLPIQYICCAHNRQAQIAEWNETKIRHYLCAYHHYISRVDTEIGKILAALKQRSDAENTLIVFTADHGDSMCGRWMGTKHTSFYDETTNIPLVFSGPGIAGRNRSISGLVSLIDLYPTLCDYAGIKYDHEMNGCSLLPWLEDYKNASPHSYVVSQWHTEWGFTIEPGRMVRTKRYKYTHYLEGNGEELYDLANDPGELKNLADHHDFKTILCEHRTILNEYTEMTNDPYFSLEWKADERWRSHKPGYCNHRGIAAPSSS